MSVLGSSEDGRDSSDRADRAVGGPAAPPAAAGRLRSGVTFEQLDEQAPAQTDLEAAKAAKAVNSAPEALFRRIGEAWAA